MKLIPLTKGKLAIVDDEDYPLLSLIKWHAGDAKHGYPVRSDPFGPMHRFLMMADVGQVVDHIDGNPLNNQRSNLRLCTQSQNNKNSRCRSNSSSKFKGVSLSSKVNKWASRITVDGSTKALGHYDNEIDAAKAYDKAAKIYHGEFAKFNFQEASL